MVHSRDDSRRETVVTLMDVAFAECEGRVIFCSWGVFTLWRTPDDPLNSLGNDIQ